MEEINFTETVDTAEDGGTIVSKLGGRLCVATVGLTLLGIVGKKSKLVVHGRGGINDVVKRSVGLVVAGVNISG